MCVCVLCVFVCVRVCTCVYVCVCGVCVCGGGVGMRIGYVVWNNRCYERELKCIIFVYKVYDREGKETNTTGFLIKPFT